ncbi:hypothetical protein FVR03_17000 [Pontibacter qinzhouensis]|uniref:Uncharacterized protein n=1 Tax=Pontibacter qinzhouensis TaxID=2603253 RepID=A0A5C8JE52_9BACT|nr:hypothetical protein [Pontibacter qinzhouensis]TXK36715.1 hypothetical protein FVR03_17000 [Pontibacter qinzhouensis]
MMIIYIIDNQIVESKNKPLISIFWIEKLTLALRGCKFVKETAVCSEDGAEVDMQNIGARKNDTTIAAQLTSLTILLNNIFSFKHPPCAF